MSADNARMLRLRDDDEQIVQPLLASALLTLSMLVVPHMDAIAKYLGMQGHHVLQLTSGRYWSLAIVVKRPPEQHEEEVGGSAVDTTGAEVKADAVRGLAGRGPGGRVCE